MAGAEVDRDVLLLRAQAREELIRRQADERCREWIVSHKRGVMWWARNLTATYNHQWQDQPGALPNAPLPYKPHPQFAEDHLRALDALKIPHELSRQDPPDYLDVVMGVLLLKEHEVHIPKTREMLTSWIVTVFLTWHCQFYESIQWISQSEDDRKAQGLIDYANCLYTQQKDWLRAMHPLKRGEEGTAHEIQWANGSSFIALPSGIRKLASFHPHGYFADEAAHMPEWKATVNVVKPAARQIVNVSSVAPSDFWNEVTDGIGA